MASLLLALYILLLRGFCLCRAHLGPARGHGPAGQLGVRMDWAQRRCAQYNSYGTVVAAGLLPQYFSQRTPAGHGSQPFPWPVLHFDLQLAASLSLLIAGSDGQHLLPDCARRSLFDLQEAERSGRDFQYGLLGGHRRFVLPFVFAAWSAGFCHAQHPPRFQVFRTANGDHRDVHSLLPLGHLRFLGRAVRRLLGGGRIWLSIAGLRAHTL
jgi:hypothetical protein